MRLAPLLLTAVIALAACGHKPSGDPGRAEGPAPQLDQPRTTTIPTVNVAKGEGWPAGKTPVAADGLMVNGSRTLQTELEARGCSVEWVR